IPATAVIPRMRRACFIPVDNRGCEILEPHFSAVHVRRLRLRSGRASVDHVLHVAELMTAKAHRFRWAVPPDPAVMVRALCFHRSRGRDQFPRQYDTSDFDKSTMVGLPASCRRLNHGHVSGECYQFAAIEKPKQAGMLDAGKRPLPVAAEQV